MKLLYKSRLQTFAGEQGLPKKDLTKVFEWYAIHLFLSRYVASDIRLTEKTIIPDDDGGIDGIAVLINGSYVEDASEVEELLWPGDENSVRVGFLQAKTSADYDTKLITRFLNGVKRVTNAAGEQDFSELEESLRGKAEILGKIIANISRFSTSRIPCDIFYVTLSEAPFGNWNKKLGRTTYGTQVDDELRSLLSLDVYDVKNLKFIGQDAVDGRREELKGQLEASFRLVDAIEIPAAQSVQTALIGLITVDELRNIVLDDNGELRENLFDDNVRLYQGESALVNREIAATLRGEDRTKFPFLNNGLTIVARNLTAHWKNYTMRGYQIVNGCQTTTEIVHWLDSLDEQSPSDTESLVKSVTVPIKVIHTEDRQSLRDITIATNSQTPITTSDIRSNSGMAMRIEEYFASIPDGNADDGKLKLRYKRQSGEAEESSIPALRTYDTTELSRAFVACVYGESSQAISQSKRIIGEESSIWSDDVSIPEALFYFSALVVYRVERALVRPEASGLKPAKYHIAMLASRLVMPELEDLVSDLSNGKRQKRIESLIDAAGWALKLNEAVRTAIDIVRGHFSGILESKSLVKDDVRSKKVQQALYAELNGSQ